MVQNYDLKRIEQVLNKHGLNLSNRAENITSNIFVEITNELLK